MFLDKNKIYILEMGRKSFLKQNKLNIKKLKINFCKMNKS